MDNRPHSRPGPSAKHRLSSFEPDTVWQNKQGQRIHRQSGRRIRYLGDWHTHPRGVPRPSRQDRRTARLIAEDPDFQTPQPLYGLAGHRHPLAMRSPWILFVLVVIHGDLEPLPMTVYDG